MAAPRGRWIAHSFFHLNRDHNLNFNLPRRSRRQEALIYSEERSEAVNERFGKSATVARLGVAAPGDGPGDGRTPTQAPSDGVRPSPGAARREFSRALDKPVRLHFERLCARDGRTPGKVRSSSASCRPFLAAVILLTSAATWQGAQGCGAMNGALSRLTSGPGGKSMLS